MKQIICILALLLMSVTTTKAQTSPATQMCIRDRVIPFFDFVVPTELPNVDPKILDPRDTYECACQSQEKAEDLAGRFIKNFAKFTDNEAGKALVAAGPKL